MSRLLRIPEKILIKETENYVKRIMTGETTGHDFFHVKRVVNMAMSLLKKENADPFITIMAAYLHDLDDAKLNNTDTMFVRNYLDKTNLDANSKNKIIDITENLSFSAHKSGKTVSSFEGMIVQDADRLDALGAIGIARCFAYGGNNQRSIYKGDKNDDSSIAHFYQKLLKLEKLMNTVQGKSIAVKRTKCIKKYLDTFLKDWNFYDKGADLL